MVVERAFGILKDRWHILLKRFDVSLQNVLNIIIASLCLHNLCILENDDFDMDWARNAQEKLQREANMALGRMNERDRFMSFESSLKEMKELQNQHSRDERHNIY